MIESGFSFAGKHCMRDFNCLYVEGNSGRIITPRLNANEYKIGGVSGSVRFPGETYETHLLKGALFPMISPLSEAEAQIAARALTNWLFSGQQRLIFDYETDKYLLAEVQADATWSAQQWLDGGLAIQFLAQPFAYAIAESAASASIGASGSVPISVNTGMAAPLNATITNTGTAALTGVTLTLKSKAAVFTGLNIASGAALAITMDAPIGAKVGSVNALPYASRFDYMELAKGSNTVGVALTYASSGTKTATVRFSARGRWK